LGWINVVASSTLKARVGVAGSAEKIKVLTLKFAAVEAAAVLGATARAGQVVALPLPAAIVWTELLGVAEAALSNVSWGAVLAGRPLVANVAKARARPPVAVAVVLG